MSIAEHGHPHIRTFRARRGRTTRPQRAWLDDALIRYGVRPDDGPIDLAATFGRVAPVVLEIGSGLGHAALGFAGAHPDKNLLAVDVHTPGIALLLSRGEAAGLTNLRAVEGDALELLGRLPPGSLAGVHVFFPDPWPKRPHRKRRFLRSDVLDELAVRLVPGARLLAATDDASYARDVAALLISHPAYEPTEASRPVWRPPFGFESRARDAGREIHELAGIRR